MLFLDGEVSSGDSEAGRQTPSCLSSVWAVEVAVPPVAAIALPVADWLYCVACQGSRGAWQAVS